VVAFAYTAFGLIGFGSTVIALPLLAQFFALKFAVPLLMLLDLAAFLLLGARMHKRIQYAEIGWLVPFIAVGMAAGLVLLIEVAEQKLIAVLGIFLLLYASYSLLRRGPRAVGAECRRRAHHRHADFAHHGADVGKVDVGARRSASRAAYSRRCSAPAECCSRSTTQGASATRKRCAPPTRR